MRTDLSFVTTLMILLSRLGNSTLRKVKTSIISELKNTPHIQQMFGLRGIFRKNKHDICGHWPKWVGGSLSGTTIRNTKYCGHRGR